MVNGSTKVFQIQYKYDRKIIPRITYTVHAHIRILIYPLIKSILNLKLRKYTFLKLWYLQEKAV